MSTSHDLTIERPSPLLSSHTGGMPSRLSRAAKMSTRMPLSKAWVQDVVRARFKLPRPSEATLDHDPGLG